VTRKRRTAEPTAKKDGRLSSADLYKALGHPLRVKILTILTERTASPNEMKTELGETVGNVGYHTRVLRDYGMVEIVEEQQVRGAVEHFYRAIERPLFDDECWSELTPAARAAISGYGLEQIVGDLGTALKAGTFDRRTERHLSRTTMLLDAEGFANVARIQNEALDSILQELAASTERRTASGEDGIPTIAAMVSFELPEPSARAGD
jgi:DNA-binding transcriptional ArsR family regulator